MQFFEILVICLGIANGALLPTLPEPTAQKKPIGAVLWFSLAFALWVGFMPVIVSSPRFLSTIVITLVGAVAGFFAVRAAQAPATITTKPSPATTTIQHTA